MNYHYRREKGKNVIKKEDLVFYSAVVGMIAVCVFYLMAVNGLLFPVSILALHFLTISCAFLSTIFFWFTLELLLYEKSNIKIAKNVTIVLNIGMLIFCFVCSIFSAWVPPLIKVVFIHLATSLIIFLSLISTIIWTYEERVLSEIEAMKNTIGIKDQYKNDMNPKAVLFYLIKYLEEKRRFHPFNIYLKSFIHDAITHLKYDSLARKICENFLEELTKNKFNLNKDLFIWLIENTQAVPKHEKFDVWVTHFIQNYVHDKAYNIDTLESNFKALGLHQEGSNIDSSLPSPSPDFLISIAHIHFNYFIHAKKQQDKTAIAYHKKWVMHYMKKAQAIDPDKVDVQAQFFSTLIKYDETEHEQAVYSMSLHPNIKKIDLIGSDQKDKIDKEDIDKKHNPPSKNF